MMLGEGSQSTRMASYIIARVNARHTAELAVGVDEGVVEGVAGDEERKASIGV